MASDQHKIPKEVFHDETPSQVVDHPFEPRAEWWTLCKHCRLAESAHKETKLPFRCFGDYIAEDD